MTFANPAVLWALPLAAAPLLLHLLSRRRARRVEFSDLTLLRQVQVQALPRTRLRQWLLAAARCGIILFLLLAYAGPVRQTRGGAAAAGAGEGIDLVLLLDSSYSMGVMDRGVARRAAARSAAEDLLRSLRPADRVACAAFSDRLEGAPGGRLAWSTPQACRDFFDHSPAGYRGTDYAPALQAAYALLAGSRNKRSVVLLSDGAAHGLRGALPPPEPGTALYCLSWPGTPFNATALSAAPARESSALQPSLRVVLWGSAKAETAVDLWLGRAHLATAKSALGPDGPAALSLPLPPARPGAKPAWSGRVELRPDALVADDSYFYSFEHPRQPRLLVLYGAPGFLKAPQAGYFLKELFARRPGGAAQGGPLDWDADFRAMDGLARDAFSDYDAAALADFQAIPGPLAAEVELFVRRGGGLWLIPGSRTTAESCAALADWLPARLGPAPDAGAARGLRAETAAGPFASWKNFELEKAAVTRRLSLEPKPGSAVWLRTALGDPLLVTGGHGKGRIALWAAPLDAASGNLPVKPVFAALVSAVTGLLRQSAAGTQSFAVKVGEPIVRAWTEKEAAPASVRLRSPEGRTTGLWIKDRRVEFAETGKPGLYEMEDDSGDRRVYAVNLDRGAGESDMSPPARPPWQGLAADKLRDEFWLKMRGQDARAAALCAAAALVLLELALALPRSFFVLLLLAGLAAPAASQQGDRFVWTQLQLGPTWDPYPDAPAEALELFATVTSVLVAPQRRVITLGDPALFQSPLVLLAGREAPEDLKPGEQQRLRAYLAAGGTLWIEDTSGLASGSFDRWVRRTLKEVAPEAELQALGTDDVVFKTFFLLRQAAGRVMTRATLEGVSWGGRAAVIYSRNDLLGIWIKDALGRPLLPCVPGGEAQRHNARKLTLNLLMYSLTGSYKADAVHQPYLMQRMRSGAP